MKICIVCHKKPAVVPNRYSMSPSKAVCLKCHGDRLVADLRGIVLLERRKPS